MSEVVVYEMSMSGEVITPSLGMEELETEITVPGYVDMEVFLFQETQTANPQILLLVAENVNFNFGPHLSVLVTFMYNDQEPGYTPAILPDTVQVSPAPGLSLPSSSLLSVRGGPAGQDRGRLTLQPHRPHHRRDHAARSLQVRAGLRVYRPS